MRHWDSDSGAVFDLRMGEEPINGRALYRSAARERDYPFCCVVRRRAAQEGIMESAYNLVAGLDVHKKIVVVVRFHGEV